MKLSRQPSYFSPRAYTGSTILFRPLHALLEPTIKVLLVDDHGLFREGMALLLRSVDNNIQVAFAGTAHECLALAGADAFDLVFLDLGLPDKPGLDVLVELKEAHPELPVIVLSAYDNRDTVLESIRRGAMGFIPKTASDPKLLWHALRIAASGAVTVPASVLPTPSVSSQHMPSPDALAENQGHRQQLTARQRDVLRLLVQGLPNKSIARKLCIAESTARGYISELLAAFGVANRTQLVVEIARLGVDISQADAQ